MWLWLHGGYFFDILYYAFTLILIKVWLYFLIAIPFYFGVERSISFDEFFLYFNNSLVHCWWIHHHMISWTITILFPIFVNGLFLCSNIYTGVLWTQYRVLYRLWSSLKEIRYVTPPTWTQGLTWDHQCPHAKNCHEIFLLVMLNYFIHRTLIILINHHFHWW
jgi:hypothetical protein